MSPLHVLKGYTERIFHFFPQISRSNKTTVTLYNLSFNSSGNYRCEVSKEGPNFETVVRNGDMRVMGK